MFSPPPPPSGPFFFSRCSSLLSVKFLRLGQESSKSPLDSLYPVYLWGRHNIYIAIYIYIYVIPGIYIYIPGIYIFLICVDRALTVSALEPCRLHDV